MRKKCRTCIFWAPEEKLDEGVGKCHRYPPQVFYSMHYDKTYEEWPETKSNHFCGEHKEGGGNE